MPTRTRPLRPPGFRRLDVELWTDGVDLVVIGDPPDEDADPSCEVHHCDSMGCGIQHVLARIQIPAFDRPRLALAKTHEESSS